MSAIGAENSRSGRRTNIEFKARCGRHGQIAKLLSDMSAEYVGRDEQIDTYFRTQRGRLKLREGSIERSLIYYERPDEAAARQSNVHLHHPREPQSLKDLLTAVHGVDVVVSKRREIFFVGNIKIHLDDVDGLGKFVEVEAIDADGTISVERLREQCDHFRKLFGIEDDALVSQSYSDLIRRQRQSAE